MAGDGLPRVGQGARVAVWALLVGAGCAQPGPDTGAQIEIVNGDGVLTPKYLLFDWQDGERVIFSDRRVPETGFLNPTGETLAVVRIESDATGDPQRRITVRGMIEGMPVSRGTGTVQVAPGQWQTTRVVLLANTGGEPDGGAPPDGEAVDAEGPADAGNPDAAPGDAAPADAADLPPDRAEAGPPDTPPEAPPPDAGRDLAPEAPPAAAPVTILASADSYVEMGTAGVNYGKLLVLEVKSQASATNTRVAYLRFPLTALDGVTVATATLRLHGRSSTGPTQESVYAVLDEAWTETGITWSNRPTPAATKLASAAITTTAQYREWNVTTLVKTQLAAGRPSVNMAVAMDMDITSAPDAHNSREATANQPQLVITR